MSRIFFVLGVFFFIMALVTFGRQYTQKTLQIDNLNRRLTEELKGKYTNEPGSLAALICDPYLVDKGLTNYISATITQTDLKTTSVDEAERRLVETYLDYQRKINSIPFIRPFLSEFPVTPKFFCLGICFKNSNNEWISPPFIDTAGTKS